MRVALIQAPQGKVEKAIPLGLLCLATYLKQNNHQPIIIDLNLILKSHDASPGFFRKAAKKILSQRPHILGFSAMCNTLPATLLIAKECKKLAPHLPIILGGPEVSFEEVELLRTFKQIDIILRGEGEITLLEVVEAIKGKKELASVLGITYRERSRIFRNTDRPLIKNLDSLPFPDFTLLPRKEKYKEGKMEAGRGCPYQCTFCSTSRMWQRTFRIKSPQRVVKEIRQVCSFYKKSDVSVVHDNLLASRKTAEKFLCLLAKEGIGSNCSSRLNHLDKKLIKKLKKAGCQTIFLGIESGSPAIQKAIKKNLPLSRLPRILDLLYQNDISVFLSFIIGFPDENMSQINQTLSLALRSRTHRRFPSVQIHPLTMFKGSEIYGAARKKTSRFYYCQTNTSPLSTSLPAEVSLIKKHPDIFLSFYYLQRKDLPPKFIEKTSLLFFFLVDFFPFTTLLLIKDLALQPLRLCQKMISFFESRKIRWLMFQDGKDNFDPFFPFLKEFVKAKGNPLIKEMLLYEELFSRSNFAKNPPSAGPKITTASRPKTGKNVMIQAFNHDIFKLIDNLSNREKKKAPKSKSFIAYVPGENAKAIPLTASHYDLLSLCNGKRSVQDIISDLMALDTKQNRRKLSNKLLNKFSFLQAQEVIYAA